jgi:hypothetical protein
VLPQAVTPQAVLPQAVLPQAVLLQAVTPQAVTPRQTDAASEVLAFLRLHRCSDLYLDLGSNIGVQPRKLFEPECYPGALALDKFADFFGEPGSRRRGRVCVVGFEPNVKHAGRLRAVEEHLRFFKGASVVFFTETAVGGHEGLLDSNATFHTDGRRRWGARFLCFRGPDAPGNLTLEARKQEARVGRAPGDRVEKRPGSIDGAGRQHGGRPSRHKAVRRGRRAPHKGGRRGNTPFTFVGCVGELLTLRVKQGSEYEAIGVASV